MNCVPCWQVSQANAHYRDVNAASFYFFLIFGNSFKAFYTVQERQDLSKHRMTLSIS